MPETINTDLAILQKVEKWFLQPLCTRTDDAPSLLRLRYGNRHVSIALDLA